jgi:hypothetical protein
MQLIWRSPLELALRTVLYELAHAPQNPLVHGVPLFSAKKGDHVPLNALTSWASLGDLIAAFNESQKTHDPLLHVDPSLKTVRDAFAHGRLVAADALTHLVLMRFAQPKGHADRKRRGGSTHDDRVAHVCALARVVDDPWNTRAARCTPPTCTSQRRGQVLGSSET